MKRPKKHRGFGIAFFLILLAIPATSCRVANEKTESVRLPLLRDFAYASQTNLRNPAGKAFELGRLLIRGKQHACLVQKDPGRISFFLQVPAKSELRYGIQFNKANKASIQARVIVESDVPDTLRREFGVSGSANLSDFGRRVATITFEAGNSGAALQPESALLWIDPALHYVQMNTTGRLAKLEQFRDRQKGKNVLIFLFDAASARHLSCYGYRRKTTPVIDSLASDGILFENAICPMPSTRPSVGTLLTGLYPDVHLVLRAESALPESFRTLAEVFQEEGYRTALFSGNPYASLGYEQGFQLVSSSHRELLSSADELVRDVNDWLSTVKNAPFFSYIHFREPHAPYKPPRTYLRLFTDGSEAEPLTGYRQKLEARYDGNLAFADSQFGKVLEHMKALSLLERTIIVVLADHGEAFWEHGARGHISQVYEEMIHIPFILRIPGEPTLRGVRRPELIGPLDILPTFVDLFGFSRKGIVVNGRSLLPLFGSAHRPSSRFLLSRSEGSEAAYALRSQEFKYVLYDDRKRSEEFYSLVHDPGEKKNLKSKYPIAAAFYSVELQKVRAELESLSDRLNNVVPTEIKIDEQTKEELRALGYID